MNGFQLAHLVTRLARRPRPRPVAIFTGLAALSMVVIGLAWLVSSPWSRGSGERHDLVRATLTDSPSWDRVRPEWPKYLPELPPLSGVAVSPASAGASVTPAVLHDAADIDVPPSILGGPELFAPAAQPVPAATAQARPPAQNAPPQFSVSRPPAPLPAPAPLPTLSPPTIPASPGRLAPPPHMRSEAMEKIAVQSDQQIRHGLELAGRGACFAARAEFTAALRLIAQGLDNDGNTTIHSQSLVAALTAMKEAQDFIPAAGKFEGELDLPPIVAGHRTPVLKTVPPGQLQSMRALKQYFTFAQEQLALAAGQEVSGSIALGALGKLHAALAGKPNPEIVAPEAKAVTFFQAAILVCPRNYMATNDLGVLLARNGDLVGARRMLEHSVLVNRRSENFNNLSVVYRRLGQQRLAELAAQKALAAKAAETARQRNASLLAGGSVQWVNPADLAQSREAWVGPSAKPAATANQQGPAVRR